MRHKVFVLSDNKYQNTQLHKLYFNPLEVCYPIPILTV